VNYLSQLSQRSDARRVLCALSVAAGLVFSSLGALPAVAAAAEGPGWMLTGRSYPTYLPPGGRGTIGIDVINVGARASEGTVTVTDTLPPGLTAREAGDLAIPFNGMEPLILDEGWDCTGNGPGGVVAGATVVTCTNDPIGLPEIPGGGGMPADEDPHPQPPVGIAVDVGAAASGLLNKVTISGGGAPTPAGTTTPITISSQKPPFGFVGWDGWFSNADGTLDTQAGSHPYEATFSFDLASALRKGKNELLLIGAGGEPRDIEIELPPGIVGDPTAVPQCARPELENGTCPQASMIGVTKVNVAAAIPAEIGFPVFNMVPPPGGAAELGFSFSGILTFLDSTLRSGSDYGITTTAKSVSQREVLHSVTTLWGVPGEASHNIWRRGTTGGCTKEEEEKRQSYCGAPANPILKPFLTVPTSCGNPLPITIRANTWQDTSVTSEATFLLHDPQGNPTQITGCERLGFGPLLTTSPETSEAESTTGLLAEVNPPLGGLQELDLLGTSDLRAAKVVLPEGFVVNPGQAAGLQACTPAQAALTTPAEAASGAENRGPAQCPLASRVGSVRVQTPLLAGAFEKELEGSVYILQSNPPELKLLVTASGDGINLKQVGTVHLDEQTGRLTSTFENIPPQPFTSFKLAFNGGAQAALITPTKCGSHETSADFTPWADPFIPHFLTSAAFAVTAGPGGGACLPTPRPFSPSMSAGTTNPVAGSASSFGLKIAKPDGQQNLKTIETTLPPGQLAKLAGVPLCPESAASSGNCPAGSQIGSTAAAVGVGADPLQVPQPGKAPTAVYLAGPYRGGPYSLVIRVPAQAGPFDLGTVTVRTALHVDETTTQVTAISDPLPQILAGVPLKYSNVSVAIDRPGFIRNPTNCEPMKVTGTIAGSEGASAKVSNRYQIGDCASLGFKPKLTLAFKGGTKRSQHPALKSVLTYPKGNYANVKRAAVTLPASEFIDQDHIGNPCTRPQFAAGSCPKISVLGRAKAWSPLLDEPLEGKVYFRSNGGERDLPDVVADLNGQIHVVLVGFVDSKHKQGSETSQIRTTFAQAPDAPVSRFVLELKGGKEGLLVNSGNLCKVPNRAIVKFTAHNGRSYDTTPAVANDCGKKKGKRRG
jgi:hypothetical protein